MFTRFIKTTLIIILSSCSFFQTAPEYLPVKNFTKKIKEKTNFFLSSYGVSKEKQEDSSRKIVTFSVSYDSKNPRNRIFTLDEARCLIVSFVEGFLTEINSTKETTSYLAENPCRVEQINMALYFSDENRFELANGGISGVYLRNKKLRFERDEIYRYGPPAPTKRNFTVLIEDYDQSLKIVKEQNCLIKL